MRKLQAALINELRDSGGCLSGILQLVKSDKSLFLGVRKRNAIVYYMGGKLLDIKLPYNRPEPRIMIDEKYFKNGTAPSFINRNDPKEWLENIDVLKKVIKDFQLKDKGQKKEKILQQKILLGNNECSESKYYIVDMEYSMPGIAYGRFDFIALRKDKQNYKYKIALVELKQGAISFGTNYKNNCIDGKNPYGSGIVGHAWNFNKFLENDGNIKHGKEMVTPISYLQKDVVQIICDYKKLGLIDSKLFPEIKDEKDIAFIDASPEEIETIFICANSTGSTEESIKKYLGIHDTKSATYTVDPKMLDRLKFTFPTIPIEGEETLKFEWFNQNELKAFRSALS
jgi:hypothetical protein